MQLGWDIHENPESSIAEILSQAPMCIPLRYQILNGIKQGNLSETFSGHSLGSALASLSVEARNYFLNKPNLQKLFPKSTLSWETN